MSDDLSAAAEALAGDAIPTDQIDQVEEPSEDDALSAIYQRMNGDEAGPAPEVAEPDEAEGDEGDEGDAKEGEDKEVTAEAKPDEPAVEAPSGLPRAVREHWAAIPEAARTEIERSQREMSDRLADQGRQIQGISPIRDSLVRAVKDLPSLANMRPEQVASEVFELAQFNDAFKRDPVGTFVSRINALGMGAAIGEALGAQPATPEGQQFGTMQREIAALKRELQQASDPQRINSAIEQHSARSNAQSEVQRFADSAPNWADVEQIIPGFIPVAKQMLGDSASGKDVLQKAYDLAIYAKTPAVKAEAAKPAPPQPDPQRAAQAMRAKSVNVKSGPTGKARPLSEDDELAAIFQRAARK